MPSYQQIYRTRVPRVCYPRSFILHWKRTRRAKIRLVLLILCLFLLPLVWRNLYHITPITNAWSGYQSPSKSSLPFADILADVSSTSRVPSNKGPVIAISSSRDIKIINPSFHILIPASESNANFCKTLLSSFLLNYPPPTMINFGKDFTGNHQGKGSNTGKVEGVLSFLRTHKGIHNNDLVLVIDGTDVWFQLPPEIMVTRYHQIIRKANERLKRTYGTITQERPWQGGKRERVQKYAQTVVFAADKICWPNRAEDPACASIPPSTLPQDVYGAKTDTDPDEFSSRPKYMSAGTIIGPVGDVRAVYERAMEKVEGGLGAMGDQFVFGEIFGEQEYQRGLLQRSQSLHRRSLVWLSNTFGSSEAFSVPIAASTNMTVVPGQRYEFGIGLDYESQLFQTMTHSASDVDFLDYSNTSSRTKIQQNHQNPQSGPLCLPTDIQRARPPFPGNYGITDLATSTLVPLSPNLDQIPANRTWQTLRLATNLYVPVVPTLLHINGDKSLLTTWWNRIWFQPHGRALLRRYMRTPQPMVWGTMGGEERTWDRRGGKGGVWTATGSWLGWGDVCKGYEEEVFGDGKGEWGREEGDGRVFNFWGNQIIGDIIDEGGS